MAKKSKAALEGEEIAPSSNEETVVAQPTEEEAIPQDGDSPPEEYAPEKEVSAEPVGLNLVSIKYSGKSPIRVADGNSIKAGQTGEVVASVADYHVDAGQAEYA